MRDVELMPHRAPLRVLLDARGRVPAEGPLFDTALAPTLVVTTEQARPGAVDAWRAAGAKVETVAPAPVGSGVDLDAAFTLLGRHGVLQALVEGGATLLGALVDGGHAQRLVAYVAPTLLGTDGVPAFAFPGPASIERRAALRARRRRARRRRRPARVRGGGLMFTGIIEELGRVRAVIPNAGGARIEIDATTVLDDAALGASIAVNGCCLTVVELGDGCWAADAVVETLRRTNLGELAAGDPVNLERPVRLADRLGGHLVQGHVDGDRHRPRPRGAARRLDARAVRRASRRDALRRAQGLDHRRRHQPHRRGDARRRLQRRGHPAHARGHDARDTRRSASV